MTGRVPSEPGSRPPDQARSGLAAPRVDPSRGRPNRITPEGWLLGKELARLCDGEAERQGRDDRCNTCAFRAGDHLANGSPETLMTALKSASERTPFWCHEVDRPCRGWLLMRWNADETVTMPWDHVGGVEACTLGVGCDEAGVCYAIAHGQPERCPRDRGSKPVRAETGTGSVHESPGARSAIAQSPSA